MRSVYLLLIVLVTVRSTHAIDTVLVGDPGNEGDTQSQGTFGAVSYNFHIGKHEVTNAQYAEFLNAVAVTDPNSLYNASMGTASPVLGNGIVRIGDPGSYQYSTVAGRANKPVVYVSFFDALRFANWLHNGQPSGSQNSSTTEDGAYMITTQGIASNSIVRSLDARYFVPSEDEWYKAAYYKGGGTNAGYWQWPTSSDLPPITQSPPGGANSANAGNGLSGLFDVGAYTLTTSPYGAHDLGGNAMEWNEEILFTSARGIRGGAWSVNRNNMRASVQNAFFKDIEFADIGFRIATVVPETTSLLLTVAALVALAARCRNLGCHRF